MSISLRKSFLCVLSFILLISILASVGFENNNIPLQIKMEYTAPAVYGQGGDDAEADTDEVVESGEEAPQQLQQDSTDNNNNNNEGNNGNGNADPSQSEQSNGCPNTDTNDFANVPTYAGQDGCVYPCPSSDTNYQINIPEGCPLASSSQPTAGFSINEERPIQPQQQQAEQSQQNVPTNTSQTIFASPRINSDTTITTTSNIPNTETTTTTTATQKSFNPAGQFKPGSGQTELKLPETSSDPVAGQYKPGSGQTELTVPEQSADPYTPGAGNDERKGSLLIPNSNLQTPIEPGNIPSEREGIRDAFVSVELILTGEFKQQFRVADYDICVETGIKDDYGDWYDTPADPPCSVAHSPITIFKVQAPGSIFITKNHKSPIVDSVSIANTCIGKSIEPKGIVMCEVQVKPLPVTEEEYYSKPVH